MPDTLTAVLTEETTRVALSLSWTSGGVASMVETVRGARVTATSSTITTTVVPVAGDVAIVAINMPSGIRVVNSVAGLGGTWSRVVGPASTTARQEYWVGTGINATGVVTVTLATSGIIQCDVYVVRGLSNPTTVTSNVVTATGTEAIAPSVNAQAGQFVVENVCSTLGTLTNGATTAPPTGWTVPAVLVSTESYGSAYRFPSEGTATPHSVTSTSSSSSTRSATIVAFGTAGGGSGPDTALVERVNASGTVVPVRGANPATLIAGAWVGDDYEAPLDEDFYYQATSTDQPDTTITSPTYNLASGGLTWLKHPGRPFLNTTIHMTRGPDLARPVQQGVFDVLGRTRPITTSMRRGSERGELVLFTGTDAERDALLELLEDGATLLLSTPAGYGLGNLYVSIGELGESRIGNAVGSNPARYWSLPFTVVDRPSGEALAVESWSSVLGAYASWSQVIETEETWTGLLEGIG